ncbi:hypothetical protein ACPUYX_03685 [Desulfosporosinus sp. SYSU MS00001]|uniref:hypothetical protein n=1 Tax=Desulfosporosinus sp. SYSU MS00001 TaxID=3416284 RepID=UPI003CEB80CB
MQYPATWIPNKTSSQPPRYEGNDGFFQISALDGEKWTIDQVAENDANHKLMPYGTAPSITKLKIQGQEARLITPSNDQPKEEKGDVKLIIKFPFTYTN